jgi:hypothetical protein
MRFQRSGFTDEPVVAPTGRDVLLDRLVRLSDRVKDATEAAEHHFTDEAKAALRRAAGELWLVTGLTLEFPADDGPPSHEALLGVLGHRPATVTASDGPTRRERLMETYEHPQLVLAEMLSGDLENLVTNPDHGREFPISPADTEGIRAWEGTIALLRIERDRFSDAIDGLAEGLERLKREGRD